MNLQILQQHANSRQGNSYAPLLLCATAAVLLLGSTAVHGQQATFLVNQQLNPLKSFAVASSTESHPFFVDIDGDGDLDCFAGEYTNKGTQLSKVYFYRNEGSRTKPLFRSVSGSANPLSAVETNTLSIPYFVDIDGDGDYDCFIGEGTTGALLYYQNAGTPTHPRFEKQSAAFNPLSMVQFTTAAEGRGVASPAFADVDGDGDYDCVVADGSSALHYFRNVGTATAPRFEEVTTTSDNPFAALARSATAAAAAGAGGIYSLSFEDWDKDGLVDLFIAGVYYHNTGTLHSPQFTPEQQQEQHAPLLAGSAAGAAGRYSPLRWVDLNGDGTPEVMQGTVKGGFVYQTLSIAKADQQPLNTLAVWIAPNPSSSFFTIHLPQAAAGTATTIRIMDVQGKVLSTQTTTNTVVKTGAFLHAGVYVVQVLRHDQLLYQHKLIKE